jgi:hypothetical protein
MSERKRARSNWGLTGLVLSSLMCTALTLAPTPVGATSAPHVSYQAASTVTGPITKGHVIEPLSANPFNLAAYGYEEKEYFVSGTAAAFKGTSMPSDGRWTVAQTSSARYKTRILVRLPKNPAHFNGTVVVEWMNVSAGESAPDWSYLNPELMQAGYGYVGVSDQALGVDGGTPILGSVKVGSSKGLVATEPARYGSLHLPGDQYALDIFAQVGQTVRTAHSSVLGSLHLKHLLAVGESQSAFYLTTFADAIQPLTHTYDGIFIHSRGGSGASFTGSSITKAQGPQNLRIRTDLSVPVFMFETQTDLIELGYAPAQQPNTSRIRTWEVAGTSHADLYEIGGAASLLGCTTPVNDGPQHYVVQAAFAAFAKWVVHGTPPPEPPPFRLASTNPPTLALDSHGNVIGGVRTPDVDVPVSTLSGAAPAAASEICGLFGSTTPFTPAELTSLYQTKSHYLALFTADLNQDIAGGYVLSADRASLLAQANEVQIPA